MAGKVIYGFESKFAACEIDKNKFKNAVYGCMAKIGKNLMPFVSKRIAYPVFNMAGGCMCLHILFKTPKLSI